MVENNGLKMRGGRGGCANLGVSSNRPLHSRKKVHFNGLIFMGREKDFLVQALAKRFAENLRFHKLIA